MHINFREFWNLKIYKLLLEHIVVGGIIIRGGIIIISVFNLYFWAPSTTGFSPKLIYVKLILEENLIWKFVPTNNSNERRKQVYFTTKLSFSEIVLILESYPLFTLYLLPLCNYHVMILWLSYKINNTLFNTAALDFSILIQCKISFDKTKLLEFSTKKLQAVSLYL